MLLIECILNIFYLDLDSFPRLDNSLSQILKTILIVEFILETHILWDTERIIEVW